MRRELWFGFSLMALILAVLLVILVPVGVTAKRFADANRRK